jgi:cytochrome c oxidase assembly protein subunit 11
MSMAMSPTKSLVAKLVGGAVAMFLFAIFVLPPIYDVFCEITGLGGKTGGEYVVEDAGVDTSRSIRVQFVATNNGAMPWEFKPVVTEVTVNPGEAVPTRFWARNSTGRNMVAQAIPSISPANAAKYFHKTECFCFNQQPLDAGEEAELPLVFIVDRDLPSSVTTITLSYTLFDVTDRVTGQMAAVR